MDKIAEIRERVGKWLMPLGATSKLENQLIRDVRYLLSELERAQSENDSLKWQMDELANMPWVELEKENRKLREERDQWQKHAADFEEMYKSEHRDKNKQLQSAQQEIERLTGTLAEWVGHYQEEHAEKVKYSAQVAYGTEREQKLIEGLRYYAKSENWKARSRCGNCGHHLDTDIPNDSAEFDQGGIARNLLTEIGVTE